MKKTLLAAAFGAALATAPAFGPAYGASHSDPVKIGFVTTLTTPAAVIGNDMKAGFDLAIEHIGGEMGGRTLEAMALIGLGIRRLSITPASVGPVKAMIRTVDASELRGVMRDYLDHGVLDIRARLTQWAAARSIELS